MRQVYNLNDKDKQLLCNSILKGHTGGSVCRDSDGEILFDWELSVITDGASDSIEVEMAAIAKSVKCGYLVGNCIGNVVYWELEITNPNFVQE